MESLRKRVQRYYSHWSSKPSLPPSIGGFEWLFSKISTSIWRPSLETTDCVDHRLIAHSRATYEELIPDYEGQEVGVSPEYIEAAQTEEIRHRIYRAIYWGNLFDHIFPIETRYYSLSTDRILKLVIVILMTTSMYLISTVFPSFLAGNFTDQAAFRSTSQSKLYSYVKNSDVAVKFIKQTNFKTPIITNSTTLAETVFNLRSAITEKVNSENINTSSWINKLGWQKAFESERRNAISDSIFFSTVINNSELFKKFNAAYKVAISPNGNRLEIVSQVVLLFFTMLMVSWFMAKKKHFFEVMKMLANERRIPAMQLLEETLTSFFSLRKKYHYFLAAVLASVAIFAHFYAMQRSSYTAAFDIMTALKLTTYDYRIHTSSQWLTMIYWTAQFVLIYFFTLVAWELGSLNSCMRQWQGKLVKAHILDKHEFSDKFSNIRTAQLTIILFAFIFACVLFLLSFLKYYANLSNISLAFFPMGWDQLKKFLIWDNLFVIYIFSPPLLFLGVVSFAAKPCFNNSEEAVKYSEKKHPDIDKALESIMEGWRQIGQAKVWIEEHIGLADEPSDKAENSPHKDTKLDIETEGVKK